MSLIDWKAALDDFEDRLTAQWAALEAGSPEPVAAFQPPTVATPVPDLLRDRATELVWRCRALEDALGLALDAAREQLQRVEDSPTAPAAASEPVYFDSRV